MERHLYTVDSPEEFNRYVRRLNIPDRAKITFWYEEEAQQKKDTSQPEDWKAKWSKVAGMWSDYDDAQDDFRAIRESLNTRIPQ